MKGTTMQGTWKTFLIGAAFVGLTLLALGQMQTGPEKEYTFKGNLEAKNLVLNNVRPRSAVATVTLWWDQERVGPEVIITLTPSAEDSTIWVGKFSIIGNAPEGTPIRLMALGRVTYLNRQELILRGTKTMTTAAEPIIDYGNIKLKIIERKQHSRP
jgi:hypothetical protein